MSGLTAGRYGITIDLMDESVPKFKSARCKAWTKAWSMRAAWRRMLDRCYNSKREDFRYYGARGIKVDSRWHRFKSFYSDMKVGYQVGFHLDRKDSKADYSKENCQWLSPKEHAAKTGLETRVRASEARTRLATRLKEQILQAAAG